jgi:protoporphyrin/coproporphyrin ferrochelatase
MSAREALLLVNMGGPSNTDEIAGYMRAIFADPFILPVPGFMRDLVSNMIVRKRTESVIDKYNLIGGKSPLLEWTEKQVELMRQASGDRYAKVTHAYRYTSPDLGEAIGKLKDEGIEIITLLPMFPHYTRAMTGSIEVEAKLWAKIHKVTVYTIDAWGLHPEIVMLQADYLDKAVEEAGDGVRVLFVAHGIPMRDVRRGDKYPDQVSENAFQLAETLPTGTDWALAYQSRVGPIRWTGPYIEDELIRLAESKKPVVIMPLSFVADCLETQYDLDLIASPELIEAGVRKVVRVNAYNDDPRFISILNRLVQEAYDE